MSIKTLAFAFVVLGGVGYGSASIAASPPSFSLCGDGFNEGLSPHDGLTQEKMQSCQQAADRKCGSRARRVSPWSQSGFYENTPCVPNPDGTPCQDTTYYYGQACASFVCR